MLFLGHVAAGVTLADATDSDLRAAVAGSIFPDVVDKTGSWVLHVFPSGRWLAHGLPFFALASAVVAMRAQPRVARGFALGYASHLVCDLYAGGKVPWLAPFKRVRKGKKQGRLKTLLRLMPPEIAGALMLWGRFARQEAI